MVKRASTKPVICRILLYNWHKCYRDDRNRMGYDASYDRIVI